ncbi:MAG: Dabb family protein [Gemmiger formicilis]|jgi:stress responsive A/B barrel domain protein|uniref:Dabb family protein n=1 Tax=Gemmiger formicilis TaxID=745368 RepID=UPI003993504A
MIKHIVFWKINKDGTDSDRRATVEAFRKKTEYLQTIIPQIKSATVATMSTRAMSFTSASTLFSIPWMI